MLVARADINLIAMASSYEFLAPKPLEGVDLPAEWEVYLEDFTQFLCAIDKDTSDDKVKVALLLRTIGERGKDIYKTFTYADGKSKDKFDDVVQNFKDFCKPRRNLFNSRDYFLNCKQNHTSIDEYLTELRKRARYCDFGDQTETLILHTMVTGLDDNSMIAKIKQMEKVELDNIVDMLRRHEEAAKNEQYKQESVSVSAVKQSQSSHSAYNKATPSYPPSKCTRCGNNRHPLSLCPARGQICRNCGKSNHFQKCCFLPKPATSNQCNSLFVGCLTSEVNPKDWTMTISVKDTAVSFLLDTGAECNTLPRHLVEQMNVRVEQCSTTLYSYSGHKLTPLGQITANVRAKGAEKQLTFIIVPDGKRAVLGGEACLNLGLLQKIDNLQASNFNLDTYKDVFDGLGCIEGEHSIKLDNSYTPVIHAPRVIPEPIREKVIHELKQMEAQGIIVKVTEPTSWVNSLVPVRKPDNSVRICIDPTDLNKAIRRAHYPLPTIETIVARMPNARVFSVLDAYKGFWQIRLDKPSSLLTTFNSPIGRYAFTRLPFGIKSAPEVFQAAMECLLEGLDGVAVIMDDILVYAATREEHDQRLTALLGRCRQRGLKLNEKKSQIAVSQVKYIGHVLSAEGVRPDPDKVTAIHNLEPPVDKTGVRRIIGMVNYLTKFVPSLSEHLDGLRRLTEKHTEFIWTENENDCFKKLKSAISTNPCLKYFDVSKPVMISVDSSKSAIGAVLLQEEKPIAYASKALTDTEQGWSQIEKEMRAVVFGAEHFHRYIYGKHFTIETDHKPLISIVDKSLDKIPPRLLNLIWRLIPYDVTLRYKRGEELYIADTLSRATYSNVANDSTEEIMSLECLPVLNTTNQQQAELKRATADDSQLHKLKSVIRNGWPDNRKQLDDELRPFWDVRHSLTEIDGLIFKDQQIVVPRAMRHDMLDIIHQSHLGQVLCIRRARESIYWPGMTNDIVDKVQRCDKCCQYQRNQQKQPLQPVEVPHLPWQTVGIDLFQHTNQNFLIVTDYYSGFIEYSKLQNTTSSNVITHIKSIFARHGIPLKVVSDNGPQFSSDHFKQFANAWQFEHRTSSPRYPQSNGLVERSVGILKGLLNKSDDPYLALLNYRNSPRGDGIPSPAIRLFGRRTRTLMPSTHTTMMPNQHSSSTYDKLQNAKIKQKAFYDTNAKDLRPLNQGETVRIRSTNNGLWLPAVIVKRVGRSYLVKDVETETIYRRNRRQIRETAEQTDTQLDIGDFMTNDIPSQTVNEPQHVDSDSTDESASTTAATPSRPTRARSRPSRFEDFVLY